MTIKQVKRVRVSANTASKVSQMFKKNGRDAAIDMLAQIIIMAGTVDVAMAAHAAAVIVDEDIARIA